ncbi:HlyD family efflux transporter periplasmic adaptor subunit [Mycobacterium sp. KBS0706]|uniref:HlyD family secretion protein n=1 Tax=Mycobacterium sp. KBS0706 TaxID=2578109 RepID=UPI00110F8E54|nr:HlyD family efflux transporter periplasmic adaptor subunit [Mycobacterium sp. KBS0706]TSD84043.1 HlyD family efflux transporter periplasmic adaptor subunit [Mycobacterium sp. KBS0706]
MNDLESVEAPVEAKGLPVLAAPTPNLPAVRPAEKDMRRKRRLPVVLGIVVLAGAAIGGWYWWQQSQAGLPAGIASGNGRIEADQIAIATKFSGRVAEILADEGDMVTAGQVVARMDTRDLEATMNRDEARLRQARQALDEARANVGQQRSRVDLAQRELDRTQALVRRGFATEELFDQRRQQLEGAAAELAAFEARAGQAEHALDAAMHDLHLDQVNIADNTLVAPKDGRIQYRLANVGEVLSAGGKVYTMLDTAYVYMDVFLPTAEAGRAVLGTGARIVLDALPDVPIPATVVFVAAQAQFTPKAVETRAERDKLMFRVRVRIDPALLRAHAAEVRSGLPGVAYLRLDPAAAWPAFLEPRAGA